MQFSKTRARMLILETKGYFQRCSRCDEAKEELRGSEFLKEPKRYNEIGARSPKVLYGPQAQVKLRPGCSWGAGVPFFSISGSDFVEMFVGWQHGADL